MDIEEVKKILNEIDKMLEEGKIKEAKKYIKKVKSEISADINLVSDYMNDLVSNLKWCRILSNKSIKSEDYTYVVE